MAPDLPYLPSYKNVEDLFHRIATAEQPEVFTMRFLSHTLGFSSANDGMLITLLKRLHFIDAARRPTPGYGDLRNPKEAGRAIARAMKGAYEPLFSADPNAHQLQGRELSGLIAQVAGADAGMTRKIAGTFRSLVRLADFAAPSVSPEPEEDEAAAAIPEGQP